MNHRSNGHRWTGHFAAIAPLTAVFLAAVVMGGCGGPDGSGADAAVADATSRASATAAPLPDDVAERARQYIRDYELIDLTPGQEEVKRAALEEMSAACCSNFSAYTCCCECNLSRTVWGLSHRLIARQGHDAEQVREAVTEWIETVAPDGFSGYACSTGRCGRAFHDDGCGGMSADGLVTG